MAEFPALPLWTDAYLGDTTHLSTKEHGAYLLLLITAWRTPTCTLPDDDALLARFTRLGPREWAKMRPVMEQFFTIQNGEWSQKKLVACRQTIKSFIRNQSDKGKKSAEARALKNKDKGSTGDQSGSSSVPTENQPKRTNHNHNHIPLDKSNGADLDNFNDPESPDFDPVKALFDDGIRILGAAGVSDGRARSLIGRWRKSFGDDSVALALADAERKGISQPLEWIPKWLASRQSKSPSGQASGPFGDPFLDAMARELLPDGVPKKENAQ